MSNAVDLPRTMLSKVPEITVWFWVIKILCTTVGESFADWINMTLGVGLITTAIIFTAVLAAVLAWQMTLDRYVPAVYWLTVVVLSVTGTLLTDVLTDVGNVPLAASTGTFAILLALVFGVWFARERTLSIHSIRSVPRESFYWTAILITFALGTAAGDWTLEITGWGPGTSVLLPTALIIAIVVGWRLGANPVLSFWLAYVLTRPLGANLGDWLGFSTDQRGLGLGVAVTSVIFLAAIVATVVYLAVTRADVMGRSAAAAPRPTRPERERAGIFYFVVLAVATAALLAWAARQPHEAAAGEAENGASASAPITVGQVSAHFPASDVENFRSIAQNTLDLVKAGDHAGAELKVGDLETAWDDAQSRLRSLDGATWSAIDGRIDAVLETLRAKSPDLATETQSLNELLDALR